MAGVGLIIIGIKQIILVGILKYHKVITVAEMGDQIRLVIFGAELFNARSNLESIVPLHGCQFVFKVRNRDFFAQGAGEFNRRGGKYGGGD